jgi:putative salt-induced outer membrane protein YdiY
MDKRILLLLVTAMAFTSLATVSRARADETPAAPASTNGLHNESEAGIVITTGNADGKNINLSQKNTYGFDQNLFRINGKYLHASTNGVDTASYWTLGVRYERELLDQLSAFLGETSEGDPFSGYLQRYSTDVGGKYFIFKEDLFVWDFEAGYRYTIENRFTGQVDQNFLRFYTEANRSWTKTFSTKLAVEYLPNLTVSTDYQLNTEISASAALNDIMALKVGYLIKYRNLPPPPAVYNTDSQFTTALVAKF